MPLLPAPLYLKDGVLAGDELVAHDRPMAVPAPPRPRRLKAVAAAAVLALLVAAGATVYWRGGDADAGRQVALEAPVPTDQRSRSGSGAPSSDTPSSPASSPVPTTTTTPPRSTTPRRPGPTVATATAVEPVLPPVATTTTLGPPPADTTPPTITGASAGGDVRVEDCGEPTTTQVSAGATDDVEVSSAVLRWTAPDGTAGSRPMTVVPWTVSDAAGNDAATTGSIAATCPVIGRENSSGKL